MYDGFDHNDDPYQFGIHGHEMDSSGVSPGNGPSLGIVLSVQAADSTENLLYRLLQSDRQGSSKCSHLEANVLLLYNGGEMYTELNHVIILQGKCSQYGPSGKEPSDWTEDVPNGCKDSELKAFYGDGGRTNIQNLSGDWVIVNFLGGLLQLPMITQWFPNPNNNRDAATKDLGKRFILRRNNTEICIADKGDFHITHRDGQYIQMKDNKITIKHRQGQMIHLDQDGKVFITDKTGNNVIIDEDGVSLVAGDAASSLDVSVDDGVTIKALKGDIDLNSSKGISLLSPYITLASGVSATGEMNATPLCVEQTAADFAVIARIISLLMIALKELPAPIGPAVKLFLQQPLDPQDLSKGTIDDNLTKVLSHSSTYQQSYITKVLLGE